MGMKICPKDRGVDGWGKSLLLTIGARKSVLFRRTTAAATHGDFLCSFGGSHSPFPLSHVTYVQNCTHTRGAFHMFCFLLRRTGAHTQHTSSLRCFFGRKKSWTNLFSSERHVEKVYRVDRWGWRFAVFVINMFSVRFFLLLLAVHSKPRDGSTVKPVNSGAKCGAGNVRMAIEEALLCVGLLTRLQSIDWLIDWLIDCAVFFFLTDGATCFFCLFFVIAARIWGGGEEESGIIFFRKRKNNLLSFFGESLMK